MLGELGVCDGCHAIYCAAAAVVVAEDGRVTARVGLPCSSCRALLKLRCVLRVHEPLKGALDGIQPVVISPSDAGKALELCICAPRVCSKKTNDGMELFPSLGHS